MKIPSLGLNESWDPFVGCKAVGPACANCWAFTQEMGRLFHLRRCVVPGERTYALDDRLFWRGPVRQPRREWNKPLHWREPRVIAALFRSDWMHADISDEELHEMTDVMDAAGEHVFITTTKRPQRLLRAFGESPMPMTATGWPMSHVWLGVSVWDQASADAALEVLRKLKRMGWHTWLSIEPMLAHIELSSIGHPEAIRAAVDGVVVGGESGAGARPMHPDWARWVRDECEKAGVPFCFKQWGEWADFRHYDACKDKRYQTGRMEQRFVDPAGGSFTLSPGDSGTRSGTAMNRVGKHAAGRQLDGRIHDALPWAKGGHCER